MAELQILRKLAAAAEAYYDRRKGLGAFVWPDLEEAVEELRDFRAREQESEVSPEEEELIKKRLAELGYIE